MRYLQSLCGLREVRGDLAETPEAAVDGSALADTAVRTVSGIDRHEDRHEQYQRDDRDGHTPSVTANHDDGPWYGRRDTPPRARPPC